MSETIGQNQVLIITIPRLSMTEKEKGDATEALEKCGLIPVFVEFNPSTLYPPRFDKVFVDAKVEPCLPGGSDGI